ncbi:MAG: response regulator [Pleurocapsa sp.]
MHNKKEECILVVDDSVDNLYLMQFVLESEGYKVGLADSGREALQKVKGCLPDLILVDLMMPQMNGYEVIHRLREDKSLQLVPVFLVTADKYTGIKEAIAAGANGIIYKPIDIDELLIEVARSLQIKNDDSL